MKFLFILFCVIVYIKSELFNLTDSNFDELVKKGEKGTWMIMFTVKKCSRCELAKEIFTNYSKVTNMTFGIVECNENTFTCLRFNQLNISRIPNLIVIEKSKYFEDKNLFIDESIINNLINNERTVEKGKKIPASIGYFGLFKRISKEMWKVGDMLLDEFVNEYLGIKIEWKSIYTIILFILFLSSIIMTEYLLYYKFCRKKRVSKSATSCSHSNSNKRDLKKTN